MTELDKDEQFYRDTESIAFPKLDDRQLAVLEPLGARRIVRRGELVFKAGQRNLGLTVVLRGELEVFESRNGQEQILATCGPRGFIGNVAMLMGTAALTNVRGKADESEILGIEVLTKTANGEADLFHQIGNCDIFKSFLGETFGGGTHEALMSFDFIVLEWPITKN